MVVRGRRRGRPRRVGGRRTFRKKAFNGGIVRGRMHPPTNSASPWNNYVLTTTWKSGAVATGFKCVTALEAEDFLRKEIGLTIAQKVNLRVTRVDVWVPPAYANSDRNSIAFAPSDWTDKVTDCTTVPALNWYEAWGTAVQPAHLHYVWPKSIATQVIVDASTTVLFQFDIKTESEYIIKFHLQWRPSTPDPKPTKGVLTSIRHHLQPSPPGTDFVYIQGQDVGSHHMCI